MMTLSTDGCNQETMLNEDVEHIVALPPGIKGLMNGGKLDFLFLSWHDLSFSSQA